MIRYTGLDALRGLAVWFMVIFHTTYDLKIFGHVDINTREGFWYYFPRLIVFIFLWCVGASLQITHGAGLKPSYWPRLAKLVALAAVISFATWLAFPNQWIYFGTLHCIAGTTLLALPFLRYPAWRLPVMLAIMVAQYGFNYGVAWVSQFFPRNSLDFIPVYPWFWVVLLGMLTGRTVLHRLPQRFPAQQIFVWPGLHALKIYLLHQPLIYGVLLLWRALSN